MCSASGTRYGALRCSGLMATMTYMFEDLQALPFCVFNCLCGKSF